MHIVLANGWYPPYSGYGGVAMYDYYLAHALAALGHRVTVLACRWTADVPATHADGPVQVRRLLSRDHARLRQLPGLGRYWRPLSQLAYSARLARALAALGRAQPIDVVEFAEVNAEGLFYAGRRRRAPVVVRCHTPTGVLRRYYTRAEMPFDTAIIAAGERALIRRADALTAPSRHMAATAAAWTGVPVAQIAVIPNALDPAAFAAARGATPAPESPFTILHVGRLERAKGAGVLEAAAPAILRTLPWARLVFVGNVHHDPDGHNWQSRIQAACNAVGAGAQVQFLGPVDQPGLLAAYQDAGLVLVPSVLYESFSYTCAQAMACGLPVVASRIAGIPETVIDGETGVLVPPGDADALSAAAIALAQNPARARRLGAAGRRRVETVFDAHRVAEAMLEVYRRAQAARGR